MNFGAILAGGIGSRLNIAAYPKQFLPLGEYPILIHTVKVFAANENLDALYIGVHPQWLDYTHELLQKHIVTDKKIVVVPGGGDRNDTLFRVIDQIESDFGADDSHIIVTHDAVRPFVTDSMIDSSIALAKEHGACGAVVPSIDTIAVSAAGQVMDSIPDRSTLYQCQTPQTFQINVLKNAFSSLTEEEKAVLTDACKICLLKGIPVYLSEGSTANIKITTMGDYNIAKAIRQLASEQEL